MSRDVIISIYFMWEWWNRYFHNSCPRPGKAGDGELVDMYLKRKRFLYEKFGGFGIGEANPGMDGRYVNMVIKWGMDFIPFVLGAELTCQDAGGYAVRKMNIETLKKLKPVDVADSPAGEWVVNRKAELLKLYGTVDQAMDLEGATNLAVRIRGEEFYMDLIEDKSLARHILEVVTATICNAYEFLGREFKLDALLIGNCNVTLMSPALYENMILEYDLRIAEIAEKVTGRRNSVRLHHCDVPVDKFIDVYKKIPDVFKLEASYTSDIKRVCREMPGVVFSAMVNPLDMTRKSIGQLEAEFDKVLRDGAGEIDIWNIDPSTDVEKLKEIFGMICRVCKENRCDAVFDVIPFCWDELEWAFPQYQSL